MLKLVITECNGDNVENYVVNATLTRDSNNIEGILNILRDKLVKEESAVGFDEEKDIIYLHNIKFTELCFPIAVFSLEYSESVAIDAKSTIAGTTLVQIAEAHYKFKGGSEDA